MWRVKGFERKCKGRKGKGAGRSDEGRKCGLIEGGGCGG